MKRSNWRSRNFTAVTGEPKYLEFARWLLEERGHGYGRNEEGTWNAAYYQDSIPVSRMTDITGHAVRCMYLFCGMADMSMLSGDTVYRAALDRVWDDVVQRNMYITAGSARRTRTKASPRITTCPTWKLIAKPALRWVWFCGMHG